MRAEVNCPPLRNRKPATLHARAGACRDQNKSGRCDAGCSQSRGSKFLRITMMISRYSLTGHTKAKDEARDPLPIVSLFCGCGGLDLGFREAGFQPVLAVDNDAAACMTYEQNHPGARVLKQDLAAAPKGYVLDRLAELQREIRPVGVIGGPPCQAFSLSNRNGDAHDKRANLPKNYAAVLKELMATFELDFFVFENVLGLRYKKHSELFGKFKRLFSSAGFKIFEGELDAQEFGVPQMRKRVFVVGFNSKKYPHLNYEFPWGTAGKRKTVEDAIGGLPKPKYYEHGLSPAEIPLHPNHWCMKPRSRKFLNGYLKEGEIKGRPFRVLPWRRPSWTVAYGHREVHIHPSGHRRLSVYEAMLLQGFPPGYELLGTLSDQIRLVSDAVPPPVAKALAESILEAMAYRTELFSPPKCKPEHRILWSSRVATADLKIADGLREFFTRFASKNRRTFPWRRKKLRAFHLLIAEVLLVQTKAEDVALVWPQLARKYPNPAALARAKRKNLVRILRPLGLQNQRARSLIAISKTLVRDFGGRVPQSPAALLSIPHIGLYTAAAVVSFAFGKRVPIVDANVLRVLGRIHGIKPGRDLRRSQQIWSLAWALLPRKNCSLHNYGLLDFASDICTAREPKCTSCPLNKGCCYGQQRIVSLQSSSVEGGKPEGYGATF